MIGFQHILVPVDYSEASDNALRMAAALARFSKGRLLVLHLLHLEVYGAAEFPGFLPSLASPEGGMRLDDERARLQRHVAEVVEAEGASPAYDVEVDWGSPYHQILEFANDRRVDVIVMGTHGRTGIKHAILGSVAERIVRLAPCPVLTVRPQVKAQLVAASDTDSSPDVRRGGVGSLKSGNPVTIVPGG